MQIRATFNNYRILDALSFRRTLGITPDVCQLALDDEAKALIRARQRVEGTQKSGEHTIIGIADARLSGLVRAIAFNLSPDRGFTTTLSLSTERPIPTILKDRQAGLLGGSQ
ncbi:MAG: hypothetical protein FJ291_24250 [Planctomycetes bacterium]|nr:hypothetical protein [Planctomycetota bacterium]